jgi:hypothetical protein
MMDELRIEQLRNGTWHLVDKNGMIRGWIASIEWNRHMPEPSIPQYESRPQNGGGLIPLQVLIYIVCVVKNSFELYLKRK